MKHVLAHDAVRLQTPLLELLVDINMQVWAGILNAERATCIFGYLACQGNSGRPYANRMQTPYGSYDCSNTPHCKSPDSSFPIWEPIIRMQQEWLPHIQLPSQVVKLVDHIALRDSKPSSPSGCSFGREGYKYGVQPVLAGASAGTQSRFLGIDLSLQILH